MKQRIKCLLLDMFLTFILSMLSYELVTMNLSIR